MSRPAALPDRVARTMISSVIGYAIPLRRNVVRWLRAAVLGAAALGTLLPSAAHAQAPADPADSGWFDPPPAAEPPPQPYYTDPRVDPAPPPAPEAEIADTDQSALTTFKPTLDPYGRWVTDSTYGTVWVPHASAVGPDFAPYVSRGHWALTADDDWIWVSDYPFGWAVFHYGRWVWISGNGWSWVPGRTYANAWVVWRVPSAGYAYVGWAPMPPSWVWMHGSAVSLWYSPPVPYVFCSSSYLFHRHVHHHIVRDRHLVHRIAEHSRVHPTPYRAPARPSARTAAAPGVRPAIAPSAAPRGPRLSAARVPAQAVPAQRVAPPPNAARLAGPRRSASAAEVLRSRSPGADARPRPVQQRSAADTRLRVERVERNTPRATAPRVEPRATAPRATAPRVEPRATPPRTSERAPAASRLRPEPRTSSSPPRVHTPSPARDMVRTAPRSPRFHRP
jgi:hypothetical protein